MAEKKLPLQADGIYHIYNRGINGCALFREESNYEHFLRLVAKHIVPIARIYAWVLMGNHFHMLLRIKSAAYLQAFYDEQVKEGVCRPMALEQRINRQFSNLFNAYSKAFNKKYQRTGSLFEHGFRRKLVENDVYCVNCVFPGCKL